MMKVGFFGFGRAGKAAASVLLTSKNCTLKWIVKKTDTFDHRSAAEYLEIKSDDPALIYSCGGFNTPPLGAYEGY
ncbi:MAG: hypothetical protein WCR31_00895 [Treponema sp.]